MAMPSSSYQDYENRILTELKSLTPGRILAFSIWCATRLMERVDLRTSLGDIDVNLLQEVVGEAWSWVGGGTAPKPEHAADMRKRVLCIGPSDPVAQIELDQRVVDTLACVDFALQYYLTGSVEQARGAAVCLISVIDYESENQIELETMFEHPPLRAEFERQLKMIDHLRTATLERTSLAQLRSFERFFR